MRICLASDTHGFRQEFLVAIQNTPDLDLILHAGDETSDVEWIQNRINCPIYAVSGNWDTPSEKYPLERLLDVGPRILLTHGHRRGVKAGLSEICLYAQKCAANIVVFGHTHRAMRGEFNGVLWINPGSLSTPRGRQEPTFAVLDFYEEANTFFVQVKYFLTTGERIFDMDYVTQLQKS